MYDGRRRRPIRRPKRILEKETRQVINVVSQLSGSWMEKRPQENDSRSHFLWPSEWGSRAFVYHCDPTATRRNRLRTQPPNFTREITKLEGEWIFSA